MKIVREIGLSKVITYLLYLPVQIAYKILFISYLRIFFLQFLGSNINKDSIILGANFFNWHRIGPGGISIGKECFIADEVLIDLYDKVVLKDQVTLAQRVLVLTHTNVGYANHPLQKYFPKLSKPVIFNKGVVIGAGSIILPGVIIGEKSFVAAGSVVTKNVPPNTLVAGVPAKVIRKIK